MIPTDDLFRLGGNRAAFERAALDTFRFQAERCDVYREYLEQINITPSQIEQVEQIPFLPIECFKWREVYCAMYSLDLYEKAFEWGFRMFYGVPTQWSLYGLLPSYLLLPTMLQEYGVLRPAWMDWLYQTEDLLEDRYFDLYFHVGEEEQFLDEEQLTVYRAQQMLQYDLMFGKGYAAPALYGREK